MHTSVLKIYQSDYPQSSWEILTFLNSAMRYKEESEVVQAFLTLCNPMDCSLPDFSVHGIFQARILEWVTIFFSRRTSQPRDRTHTFCASCINKQILHHWATTWLIRVYSLPINMYLLPFWGSLFWTHKFRFPITNCSCHLCIHNNLSHNIYQSIEWCHLFLNCKYPSLDSNFIFISVTWYSKVIYKLMNEYRYLCCA